MAVKKDALDTLFGSSSIVKTMRLFLFHPSTSYSLEDIANKIKSSKDSIKNEVSDLEKAGLIKKRSFFKKVETKNKGKTVLKNKRVSGFILNENFHYLSALKQLLIKIPPITNRELEHCFSRSGSLKLLIVAGVFIQDWDSEVDLLIVGDKMNTSSVDRAVATLEAKIGRELTFSLLDTRDFEYRVNVNDRFIRDVLDFNHQKVVNKIGI